MQILTAEAIRGLEAKWAATTRLPSLLLMEHAAAGVLRALHGRLPARIGVLAGPGNNGGDGLAFARLAAAAGHDVRVLLAAEPERLAGDAALNLHAAMAAGVPVVSVFTGGAAATFDGVELVVDALLGIGQQGPPRGRVAAAHALLMELARTLPVVAVDVPTGACADTGRLLAEVAPCVQTVTFHGLRWAHVLPPSRDLCGDVEVVPIGLDAALGDAAGVTPVVDAAAAAAAFGRIGASAHKRQRGHVLLVAGSAAMPGAAALATLGAFAAGAGLVTVAAPPVVASTVLAHAPEALWFERGALAHADLDRFDAFVVGPGLGVAEEAVAAVRHVIGSAGERPVIIDADAIGLYARLGARARHAVVTPHPGELARLLDMVVADVVADLPEAARAAQRATGATVVAKTAGALIAGADTLLFVEGAASALGVAGSGDVLAGAIGAIASRSGATAAARAGAWLHQRAGVIASLEQPVGARASDIARALRAAIADLPANGR
jgi:hydroxyethylthiazole kinase-like uncharacterized protein yjeF